MRQIDSVFTLKLPSLTAVANIFYARLFRVDIIFGTPSRSESLLEYPSRFSRPNETYTAIRDIVKTRNFPTVTVTWTDNGNYPYNIHELFGASGAIFV